MTQGKIADYKGGWIMGDFDPTIWKTKDFECGLKFYKKGDSSTPHVHKETEEITIAASGEFVINGVTLKQGDFVIIHKGEPASFVCNEDGATVVLKKPSIPSDKFNI